MHGFMCLLTVILTREYSIILYKLLYIVDAGLMSNISTGERDRRFLYKHRTGLKLLNKCPISNDDLCLVTTIVILL